MIAPRLFRATLTLALLGATAVETFGGPVIISTRKQVCADQGTDNADAKGPGMTTPGDVGMAILLGNHGYSSRLILDTMITADPALYFEPADPAYAPSLAIWSGSSSSADIPAPPEGVPLMMGEHVTLGNRADRAGSIFMYAGQNSNDPNDATVPAASKYMKVLDPNHPIMAGIPLDAQGRVKIFREPYPNEEKNVPAGAPLRPSALRCGTLATNGKSAATTRNTSRLATCPAASMGNEMSAWGLPTAAITPLGPCSASMITTSTATLAMTSITTATSMASMPCHQRRRRRGTAGSGSPGGSGMSSATGGAGSSTQPTLSGRFSPSKSLAKLS